MSDIFEIKSKKIELKLGDKTYPLVDPKVAKKVEITKAWDALSKKKDTMDSGDFALEADELNRKMILTYIPSLPIEILESDDFTPGMQSSLMEHIQKIIGENFGAVVKEVDSKK